MANKNSLKKEDKKESKQSKRSSYKASDEIASKSANKLKTDPSKEINKWNDLANIVTINSYD